MAAKDESAKQEAPGKVAYVVAPGISTICARGNVADGAPVSVEDFASKADFDDLVARGVIVKAP